MADTRARFGRRRLNVLVLARSFPSALLPNNGLWTLRPTLRVAEMCDVRVVSPVPYCPPLPQFGPLHNYARFRTIPRTGEVRGLKTHHPRFAAGFGSSLHAIEGETYYVGVRSAVDRLWREQSFDLIHANHIYPDGAAAHRLARRYGVPFVVTEHAPWTGWVSRRSVGRLAIPAATAAAAVIAPSSGAAATIHEHAPTANVRIVPPGVDGDEFQLAPAEARRADQILFVGFINHNKGVDVLLRAMVELRERGIQGRLLVAGGAHYKRTLQEETKIRALATELALGNLVTFLGPLPPEVVSRLMGESAVVVLPSRAESFGAVLAEALSCGTPVVATRCGGPEDIVDESVGELVPVDDHVSLADALARVLAARERYAPEELRAYALAHFGLSTVVEKLLEVYETAVAGVPATAPEPPRAGEAA